MNDKPTYYIFHLYRKEGSSMMLHPFLSSDKLVSMLEKSNLVGRYGKEPRVEALTMFRNELYRQIEAGVKNWLSEVRFIPKFLISSAVFLFSYFFLSFVIRDPLPVLDEIAIGLGASILTYYMLGKKDMASERATKKRLGLRVIVDKIVFRESEFVKQVESALHRNEAGSMEEVIKQIVEPSKQELGDPFREEAGQFIQLLENHFNFRKLRKEEKLLKKFLKNSKPDKNISNLKRLIESKELDFPLYAVYKSFKKTVGNIK